MFYHNHDNFFMFSRDFDMGPFLVLSAVWSAIATRLLFVIEVANSYNKLFIVIWSIKKQLCIYNDILIYCTIMIAVNYIVFKLRLFNALWPSDSICCHRIELTLVQVMPGCLIAPLPEPMLGDHQEVFGIHLTAILQERFKICILFLRINIINL